MIIIKTTMQLQVEKQPAMTLVHCACTIMSTCPDFSKTVCALIPEGKPIRVDLGKVVMVDSVGMATFHSVWKRAKNNGCDLKFINPSQQVRHVVETSRLHDMFELPATPS